MKNKFSIFVFAMSLAVQNSFVTARIQATSTPNYFMTQPDNLLGTDAASRPPRNQSNNLLQEINIAVGSEDEKKFITSFGKASVAHKVGGPATYAPSAAENMLNRILQGLRKLRMEDYATFKKYFERVEDVE